MKIDIKTVKVGQQFETKCGGIIEIKKIEKLNGNDYYFRFKWLTGCYVSNDKDHLDHAWSIWFNFNISKKLECQWCFK